MKANVSGPNDAMLATLPSPPSAQKDTEPVTSGTVLARGTHVGAEDSWIVFIHRGVTMSPKSSVIHIDNVLP